MRLTTYEEAISELDAYFKENAKDIPMSGQCLRRQEDRYYDRKTITYLTFTGVDGVGKTTLFKKLQNQLDEVKFFKGSFVRDPDFNLIRKRFEYFLFFREPSDTVRGILGELAEGIRSGKKEINFGECISTVFATDRTLIQKELQPWFRLNDPAMNKVFIASDRSVWCSFGYDFAKGFPLEYATSLNHFVFWPEHIIVCKGEPFQKDEKPDYVEGNNYFQTRLKAFYDYLLLDPSNILHDKGYHVWEINNGMPQEENEMEPVRYATEVEHFEKVKVLIRESITGM